MVLPCRGGVLFPRGIVVIVVFFSPASLNGDISRKLLTFKTAPQVRLELLKLFQQAKLIASQTLALRYTHAV